jgi:hypothetical protein
MRFSRLSSFPSLPALILASCAALSGCGDSSKSTTGPAQADPNASKREGEMASFLKDHPPVGAVDEKKGLQDQMSKAMQGKK